LGASAHEKETEELFGGVSLAHKERVNVISSFTTKSIVLRETIVSCAGIESVCTLVDLEFAVSLTEAEASLSGQYETNLRIEIRDQHFSVHR
jgi:predicted subunit of tRNA(5-methylaminomethyl-2-thiouridylate) methyltransferase